MNNGWKDPNTIVQSLWIGDELTNLERLALTSFLHNGFEVHLYTYNSVQGVPEQVSVEDANSIVPESEIFLGPLLKTPVGNKWDRGYEAFSDFFRYKLLYQKGGWWTDLDVICLQPFAFADEYAFASQRLAANNDTVKPTGCLMKLPKGSELALYCLKECKKIADMSKIQYSEIGPTLVSRAIEHFHLNKYVKAPVTFCPIHWWEIGTLLEPNTSFQIIRSMHAIHCFTSVWKSRGYDKNIVYNEFSVFEQLKRYYLPER